MAERSAASPHRRTVVVGVDGSAESDAATVWAASEAASRGARLRIVFVCDSRYLGIWTMSSRVRDELRAYGKPLIDQAVALTTGIIPADQVDTAVIVAPPGRALTMMSAACELLVIGRTGRGALSRLIFGSTTREVLAAAQCPVVAVTTLPPQSAGDAQGATRPHEGAAGRVVLALRDTATNARSLHFAFDYADRHQAPLSIVHAGPSDAAGPTDAADAADVAIADEVSGWQAGHPRVAVTVTGFDGAPRSAVATACRPDDLLVTGHHRHSPLSRHPLGPHLLDLLYAAPCPVAVVPEYPTQTGNPPASPDRSSS